MQLLPGTEVYARGLRWEVVSSESLGPQTLYRLRGMENAVLGHEIDILYPFESIEPVRHELRPDRAAPLINWLVYHQAFLLEQALGPGALLAVQPGRLRIEPYQLVPVLRAIRMSRVRLLLADGVGLGKTIQAGLVITELVARRLAHRILVVSPAGPLMEQWHIEMSERFGLRFEVIDRAKLEEIRRSTELGSNPFDYIPLGLSSIDFLKQERVLDQLERASYDVVVIDEAHHCMDIGALADREDSQRRRLAEVLARRCDSLILITATPHDGFDRSFASLCELLDPSLVDGRGSLRGERYRAHVVRRLKKHILVASASDPAKKEPLFKERVVTPVPVTPDPKRHARFTELQRTLLNLIAPELRRAFRTRNYSDVLAYMALLKRSVSTAFACRQTLAVVASRFQEFLTDTAQMQEVRRQRLKTLRDYERKLERFGSISAEEERERSLLEAEDLAHQLATLQREIARGSRQQTRVANILEKLNELINLAESAQKHDPKLEQLAVTIREIRENEPNANVLVYTEYVDSQRAAVDALKAAQVGPVITMKGEDDEKTRAAVSERFRTEDNLILISTDSAAEGLNLHQRCHHLIHLELPFNPNRLEQRNGRIDRYGQTVEPQIKYLFLRGTFEERILLRLIAKYEKQRARLTFVPNTLGVVTSTEAAQARLLKGLIDEDNRLFQDEPYLFYFHEGDEAEGADEATRELLEEIDRSLNGFKRAASAHAWLGDAGLNAEEKLLEEAEVARREGSRAEHVDLAKFVRDAVLLDGGEIVELQDDYFVLRIPPAWSHGLNELPGYDPDQRLVRLTTKLDVTRDKQGHPVGFLGRAHPLVRRALDRVRNLSFGATAKQGQDPRVSAVKADVSGPTLLFTFLGRVSSSGGREFERVLAVLVNQAGETQFYDSAESWSHLVDPAKAVRTTELWKRLFESWAGEAEVRAKEVANAGFKPIAEGFIAERKRALQRERADQNEWLQRRAEEITGTTGRPVWVQISLFDQAPATDTTSAPAWQKINDPVKRLAAFHMDRNQPPAARSEAEGVLRIYKQRMNFIDSLLDLREPEIIPLGLLMLIPEVQYGA
ncbi:helicase-related protein [Desulfofundulus thermosubterraneus]|uniref:SNF2 family N-terminal domain-containing protein n=1 Tax=Desulfofundulus thermosubterraneus DSM 16057 TaxID=1121432 RepID=A0A1M6MB50_9FIRM|nr:helicase-related protein [Desulfofundulus thermosubterraneus]SHJ80657.1 SNF2 family N-terminal domain-containing protein [Desulfofundulus thermosubterraneus DSM 16057]